MDLSLTHFPLQADSWQIRSTVSRPRLLSPPLRPGPSLSLRHLRHVRYGRCTGKLKWELCDVRAQASNVGTGSFEGGSHGDDSSDASTSSNQLVPPPGIPYPLSTAGVLAVSAVAFALIVSLKGGPSTVIDAVSKSGFTAAFTLISVSEIGDKTFFIAALLAMQYKRALVLLGSMGALSLMTILSVVIGRIFQSVPSQFQTTLPIGEYAAVALLTFFGLKSIKDAWELPSNSSKDSIENSEQLGEFVEAEELVKEKTAKKLTNPAEIVWESFSLIFFAVVGRPIYARNHCSGCCSVSFWGCKWGHSWTPHSHFCCHLRGCISGQLYL
ncbi:protein PAM71-homolog, chloroplastic isoform X2 [Carex rostrata]